MTATPPAADETVAPLDPALVRTGRTGSGWRPALPNKTASGAVTSSMDRRAFLATLAGGLLAAPPAVKAQPAGKVYRIGLFHVGPDHVPPSLPTFRTSMKALGYEEGRNVPRLAEPC